MAFQSVWYETNLPNKIVKIIEEDVADGIRSHFAGDGN